MFAARRRTLKIAMQTVGVAALMRNVERQIIYEDNATMSFVCQGDLMRRAWISSRSAAHRKRDQFSLGFLDVIDDQHFHRTRAS